MKKVIKILFMSVGLTCLLLAIVGIISSLKYDPDGELRGISISLFVLGSILMWITVFIGNKSDDSKYLNRFLSVPIFVVLMATLLYFIVMVFLYNLVLGIILIILLLILLTYKLKLSRSGINKK